MDSVSSLESIPFTAMRGRDELQHRDELQQNELRSNEHRPDELKRRKGKGLGFFDVLSHIIEVNVAIGGIP